MYITKYKTNKEIEDILITSDGKYLTGLYFDNPIENIKLKNSVKEDNLDIFNETKRWLDIYFSGIIPNFTPRYKIEYTSLFQKEVIDIVSKIPYGKTITYGEIAKVIASLHHIEKMSARAVGGAINSNPICIIIPCHRVLGVNSLTGYRSNIKNKIYLLELEGNNLNKYKIPKEKNNE